MKEDKGLTVSCEVGEFNIYPDRLLSLIYMVVDELEAGKEIKNEDALNLLKEVEITISGLCILLGDISDELDKRDIMNAQHLKNVKNVTIN